MKAEVYRKNHFRVELIVPIIRKYLASYQAQTGTRPGEAELLTPMTDVGMLKHEENAKNFRNEERFYFATAINVLSAETGISVSTIQKYLDGTREWISFDFADKLMCKMNTVMLWYVEPLRSVYYAVEV